MLEDSITVGTAEEANKILQEGLQDNTAQLTRNQYRVIGKICDLKQDVLYIDRTGAGKSETYFVATKLLRRDPDAGPVIVVTPLVALIHDQVRRAQKFGLKAEGYFSEKKGMSEMAQASVRTKMQRNNLDLLFLTAEMLQEISLDTRSFKKDGNTITYEPKLLKGGPALKRHPPNLNALTWKYVPLLVIDEIHYISEAGHDFRMDYATVWSKLEKHPWFIRTRKLGLTATVSSRVRASLEQAFPAIKDWKVVLGSLYRENIALRILPKPATAAARLDYVAQLYKGDPKANILVFCQRIEEVKEFSSSLAKMGVSIEVIGYYYSSKSSDDETVRKLLADNEKGFREGRLQVLFSTCVLGLGYDKKDVHHVVHMWTPNTIVQYYQEFGRAGRSQGSAVAHMLPTTPWNPTGWVAVLSSICWILARTPNHTASLAAIKAREQALQHKESDIYQAIELGCQKKMLESFEEDGTSIRLLDIKQNLQAIDKIYADHMKEEKEIMYHLSHNCGQDCECLWRYILAKFEGEHNPELTCNKCSGLKCSPGGDISPDSQAGGNVFYEVIAPQSQVPIFALNKVGEDLLVDQERLKEIFFVHHPSMVTEPPGKWTICPIPDSDGNTLRDAHFVANELNGIEVNTFIQKNPAEKRTVTKACSKAERRDILKSKFMFDWNKMPKVGNVMIFDDRVSSGDTIDTVVMAMRSHLDVPMEFAALTKFVYVGAKVTSPQVRKLSASVKDEGIVEQEAQK